MARSVEELLKELLEFERLQARLDFGQFLDWAVRQGRARKDIAAYTYTVTAGGSSTLTVTNPKGYVWIPHQESIWVEAANIMALELQRDGETFLDFPALPTEVLFNWNTAVPWKGPGVIKGSAVATFTNSDVADRWVIGGYIGTYLLFEEYDLYMKSLWDQYPRQWKVEDA